MLRSTGKTGLFDDLVQLAFGVTFSHFFQRDGLDLAGATRRYMFENPGKFDPRDYLKPAREAAKKICLARFEAFGTAGNASKIKPINLDKIAAAYKSGALNQIVR